MSHIASIGQQTEQSAEKDRKAEAWPAKPLLSPLLYPSARASTQLLVPGLTDEAGLRALGDRVKLLGKGAMGIER
jgi:hypothetical protein